MRSGELDMETAFEVSMALSEMAVVGFLSILEKYDESRKRTIMRYTEATPTVREAQIKGAEAGSIRAKIFNGTVKQQRITSSINSKS